MTFESLPEEILNIILRSCSGKDIRQLSVCNRFLFNATKPSRWNYFIYDEEKVNCKLDSDRASYVKNLVLSHCAVRSNQKSLSSYAFKLGQLLSSVNIDGLLVRNSFPENICLDEMMASLTHLTYLQLCDVKPDDWSPFNNLGRIKRLYDN